MEEFYIELKGRKVFYKHSGSGPKIVLLHGIPTHSGLWDGMADILSQYYEVYAFDLLGFGKSEKLDSSEIHIKSQSKFFLELFEKISLKDITIIGHDMGGGIAQIMAVTNPSLFKSMVLIDSACYDSWPIMILREENKLEMLFEHLPPQVIYDTFKGYIRDGLYNKEKAEKIANKYWKYIGEKESIKTFLEAVSSFDNKYTVEVSKMLGSIRIPVLIIWGKLDTYIKMSYGYRLSEDIRNSSIEVIDNAGHFLPEDQPEKASEIILSFLKKWGI